MPDAAMRRRMAALVAAFGRGAEMTAIVQRFTQIRREETAAVVASALCFFFILTALMVLREALGMRLRGTSSDDW
jgi:ATP/ADP translocase